MKKKVKTVDQIMAAKPWEDYPRERVKKLVGKGITEDQLVRLDIPRKDIFGALFYVWMTPRQQRHFACDCAERTIIRERDAGYEPDPLLLQAVKVVRRYADGKATPSDMATAGSAVWGVAGYSRGTGTVDWTGIWTIARAAAWAATDVIVDAVDLATEVEWRIQRALFYIKKNEKIHMGKTRK